MVRMCACENRKVFNPWYTSQISHMVHMCGCGNRKVYSPGNMNLRFHIMVHMRGCGNRRVYNPGNMSQISHYGPHIWMWKEKGLQSLKYVSQISHYCPHVWWLKQKSLQFWKYESDFTWMEMHIEIFFPPVTVSISLVILTATTSALVEFLMCCQQREGSAHSCKVWQKCRSANEFGKFSLSLVCSRPGLFSEWQFAVWTVGEKCWSRKWCVLCVCADWLTAFCQTCCHLSELFERNSG